MIPELSNGNTNQNIEKNDGNRPSYHYRSSIKGDGFHNGYGESSTDLEENPDLYQTQRQVVDNYGGVEGLRDMAMSES